MSEENRDDRESMEYDVVIVGAGPAGLSCSIRLKQLAAEANKDISVCILEKGAEVGSHLLSGAVLETKALDELIPDWKEKEAPLNVKVVKDEFLFLTKNKSFKLPTPPQMNNHGNYIISLVHFSRWLSEQAEALGVEIYPGFAASEILFNSKDEVIGVATNDLGIDKQGNKTDAFEPGMELRAKQTVFAEGCHGSLTKILIDRFKLRENSCPQTYALGLKEIWEVDESKHSLGHVCHSIGWPLSNDVYGGSFLYHAADNLVYLGFVVGLDYKNPYLSPFQEMQRFKMHPKVKGLLEGGRCIAYGAKTLVEGGLQSLPKLTFPGGVIVGDSAGFLNVAKIKGNHTAMKSGMLAAEALYESFGAQEDAVWECIDYEKQFKESWVYKELKKVRNIRPGFHKGLWFGLLNAAYETVTLGLSPWTLKNHSDYSQIEEAKNFKPIEYPKPDGILTFDRLTSVQRTNTFHEEDQPVHLVLKSPSVPIEKNLKLYDEPAQRYCPAGVYEVVDQGDKKSFVINSQNCIHCKTCDIKDPSQNITWTVPQGGGGPNYSDM